jgi:hypothetical protein
MKDISATLKQVYNADGVAIVPGSGSYAMEVCTNPYRPPTHPRTPFPCHACQHRACSVDMSTAGRSWVLCQSFESAHRLCRGISGEDVDRSNPHLRTPHFSRHDHAMVAAQRPCIEFSDYRCSSISTARYLIYSRAGMCVCMHACGVAVDGQTVCNRQESAGDPKWVFFIPLDRHF